MADFNPAPAGETGNLADCVTTKEMTALAAVTAIRDLVAKYPANKKLGIGVWEGDVTGKLSGNTHGGKHLGVFNANTLVALFGPHGDAESESLAATFVVAVQNADKMASVLQGMLNLVLDARSELADQCDCEVCPICRAYAKLTAARKLAEGML